MQLVANFGSRLQRGVLLFVARHSLSSIAMPQNPPLLPFASTAPIGVRRVWADGEVVTSSDLANLYVRSSDLVKDLAGLGFSQEHVELALQAWRQCVTSTSPWSSDGVAVALVGGVVIRPTTAPTAVVNRPTPSAKKSWVHGRKRPRAQLAVPGVHPVEKAVPAIQKTAIDAVVEMAKEAGLLDDVELAYGRKITMGVAEVFDKQVMPDFMQIFQKKHSKEM